MEALLSFVGLLVFFAIGAFSIYIVIDFIEYLKKYHSERWSELSFASLFGISQQDLFFYQIHPLKFIPYIFNKDDFVFIPRPLASKGAELSVSLPGRPQTRLRPVSARFG
jgi:hypothetical protein